MSLADAEAKEAEAWGNDITMALRYNLRRCMGTGNAQLKHIDNGLFPEAKASTNLEGIAKKALIKKGLAD